MYIPLDVFIFIIWILLGIFCYYKQNRVQEEHIGFCIVTTAFAPIWFIGAIIRQVIIEDWK